LAIVSLAKNKTDLRCVVYLWWGRWCMVGCRQLCSCPVKSERCVASRHQNARILCVVEVDCKTQTSADYIDHHYLYCSGF